jgi:hypothetical protein
MASVIILLDFEEKNKSRVKARERNMAGHCTNIRDTAKRRGAQPPDFWVSESC